jgi:hypothetical protein
MEVGVMLTSSQLMALFGNLSWNSDYTWPNFLMTCGPITELNLAIVVALSFHLARSSINDYR